MTVFARIDHAAGAASAGLPLRPTEVLIFGNAKGGTPLMQSVQTIGIDLPLKALVWQDASGQTWFSYNDPAFLAQRHGLGGETAVVVGAMTAALDCAGESRHGRVTGRSCVSAAEHRQDTGVTSSGRAIWRRRLPVFDSRSSASRPPAA